MAVHWTTTILKALPGPSCTRAGCPAPWLPCPVAGPRTRAYAARRPTCRRPRLVGRVGCCFHRRVAIARRLVARALQLCLVVGELVAVAQSSAVSPSLSRSLRLAPFDTLAVSAARRGGQQQERRGGAHAAAAQECEAAAQVLDDVGAAVARGAHERRLHKPPRSRRGVLSLALGRDEMLKAAEWEDYERTLSETLASRRRRRTGGRR